MQRSASSDQTLVCSPRKFVLRQHIAPKFIRVRASNNKFKLSFQPDLLPRDGYANQVFATFRDSLPLTTTTCSSGM